MLSIGGRDPFAHHGYVNPPVYHASTVLYRTAEDFLARRGRYRYGRRGTPTSEALEKALARARRAALRRRRVAAVRARRDLDRTACGAARGRPCAGDRQRLWADAQVLRRRARRGYGVTTTYYDPLIGAGIAALMQPNTRAVFSESPGSLTLRDAGHSRHRRRPRTRKARVVLMDNTWASPLYFRRSKMASISSIQAGTKYIGGHSDLMLGTVSANEDDAGRSCETPVHAMGLCVGPDDMYLGLRGLRTLGVRLARHQQSGLAVARWLEAAAGGLARAASGAAGHPGHAIWQARLPRRLGLVQRRAQAGAAEGRARLPQRADALRHGRLVGRLRKPRHSRRCHRLSHRDRLGAGGPTVRFHIGLEDVSDLIADLERGFRRARRGDNRPQQWPSQAINRNRPTS